MTNRKEIEKDIIQYFKNEIYFHVAPSGLDGVGLFAIKDIPKNTNILVEFDGRLDFSLSENLMIEEVPDIWDVMKKYYTVSSCKDPNAVIRLYPYFKLSHTHYLNHSDDNNLKYDSVDSLIAVRDIIKGEELTINYFDPKKGTPINYL